MVSNLCCSTAADTPYCSSFTFSNVFTDAAPEVEFIGYMCAGVKGNIGQGAYTTYVGQNDPLNFTTTTVLFLETLSGNITSPPTSSLSSSSAPSSAPSSSLLVSSTTTSSSPTSSPSVASSTTVSAGPIVGGVLGGVAALVAVAAGIYFCRRNRRDPVAAKQTGDGAYLAPGNNTLFPIQGFKGAELEQKVQVAEVAGDRGVHEIMGSEVYRS